ncbi:uncharacterized protein LOC136747023 [Amia ocellicauda]|uniref:uncharacterized protein LOC136747023 n=1 Tax=Amia ocellicauda TaxID=2972642 RepID=UPI0034645EA1
MRIWLWRILFKSLSTWIIFSESEDQQPKHHATLPGFFQHPNLYPCPNPCSWDRTQLTAEERQRRIRLRLCLYCGQEGHYRDTSPVCPGTSRDPAAMEEYIKEALEQGIIRPSTSPAVASFFFVAKKDGLTLQENVRQATAVQKARQGEAVHFQCAYLNKVQSFYLFWYEQLPNKPPQYLLQKWYLKDQYDEPKYKGIFETILDKDNKLHTLKLLKAKLRGPVSYLCALNDGGNEQLHFGNGTRLDVLAETECELSTYTLQPSTGGPGACLVTGVEPGVSRLEPSVLDGESCYSVVAVLPQEDFDCAVHNEQGDSCFDYQLADEKTNFLSLTVMALRIICLKSVILGGLLTLQIHMAKIH